MSDQDLTATDQSRGFTGLNWVIALGGFFGGLVFGGMLLFGQKQADSDTKSADVSAKHAFRQTIVSDEQSKPDRTDDSTRQTLHSTDRSNDLQSEVERLRMELEQVELQSQVDQLKRELSQAKVNTQGSSSRLRTNGRKRHTQVQQESKTGNRPDGKNTLAYWNQLNSIIEQEAAMRRPPEGGLSAANVADFLQRRGDAGKFAADSIRGLNNRGVDSALIVFGGKLAKWYENSVDAAQSGGSLLGADPNSRRGKPGQTYKKSEHQLQSDVKAINKDGQQLRSKLSRKYDLVFPPLK